MHPVAKIRRRFALLQVTRLLRWHLQTAPGSGPDMIQGALDFFHFLGTPVSYNLSFASHFQWQMHRQCS